MSQAKTINGPLFVNGDLTVAGNINKGALTQLQNTTKAQAAALGAMPTLTQIDQGFTNPTAGTNQGTPTPATLAAPTVVAFYDSNQISWIAQRSLRWLSSYNVQVSVDNLNWYSLDQSGANANGLGVLNAVTTCSDPRILHQNIKFASSPPTAGILLYYRVRQVTVLGVVSSWSPASSGTAVPIQGASQILAASILGTNIAANTITADRMIATYLQFAASLGSQYNAVPNPGDLRTLLMNPQNPLSGEAGYVNIDQYAADGSGWSQNLFSIEPSTTGNANVLDLFISGRLFARDSVLSAPGRFFFKAVNSPFGTNNIYAVAYGNGVFVAGGVGGGIARSTDGGVTWGSYIGNPFTTYIDSIAYGNGVFVALGNNGQIARSTDGGVTWGSLITNPLGSGYMGGVAYGNGVFVVVGYGGKIARSTDGGITWGSLITNPFGTASIQAIAYGNGIFVAVCNGGAYIARSTDGGVTWGSLITNPFTTYITDIAYGNGVFVAIGAGGGSPNGPGQIARSTDGGVTWGSLITNPFGTEGIQAITYLSGVFVVGGQKGNACRSLDLGLTWGITYTNNNVESVLTTYIYSIASNGINRIVVAGYDSSGISIAYSDYVEAGAGIVNSGSNSNGSFVQFADGTMECRAYIPGSTYGSTQTFPGAFTARPEGLSLTPDLNDAGAYFFLQPYNVLAYSFQVNSRTAGGGTGSFGINYIAIGRWR